jgi:tripartite-type tricarboxylate transporter receptor subunit TctC
VDLCISLPPQNSPASIFVPGGERRRVPGHFSRRRSANLSDEAGANHLGFYYRWCDRHCRAPDGAVALGAARPTVHYRESAGCRRKYRYRGVRECATRRLHAPLDRATSAVNATLYEKLSFNFIRDIAPVAGIVRTPLVMEVNPSFPAKTVPPFIAYAKANPGRLNMASAGSGSLGHVAGELFKMMPGVNMIHVPYRGGAPAITDLLGGQVQVIFSPTPDSIGFIRSGRLRALAVTTATCSEALPDVPTVGDFVPGYEARAFYGVGAPKTTPAQIVDKLNREINVGLGDSKMKARLVDLGGIALAGSPADFGMLVANETEKWGKVIAAANIKAE